MHRHVTPLIETILYGTGVAAIVAGPTSATYGNLSVLSNVINIVKAMGSGVDVSGAVQQIPGQLQAAVMRGDWIPPIAGGLLLSFLSRKLHLGRHTMITKKISAV